MDVEQKLYVVCSESLDRKSITALGESLSLPIEFYSSAEAFLSGYTQELCGCLLIQHQLPGMNGLELLVKLAEQKSELPTVLITVSANIPMSVEAMSRGAVSVLEEPYSDHQLRDAINQALQQDRQMKIRRQIRDSREARFRLLTGEEKRLLDLIVDGASQHAIASHMRLKDVEVESRRAGIMKKLQLESVAELVKLLLDSHEDLGEASPNSNQ